MKGQDEFDGIIVALDALLTAIEADNEHRRGDHRVPYSMADAQWMYDETLHQRAAHDVIQNPVGQALRNAVKLLGERLNERGSMTEMQDALDCVARLNPDRDSWREAILDRLWSGIGSWLT